MKSVIIIDDDYELTEIMQKSINELDGFCCDLKFNNPIDYLNNPVLSEIILLDIVMPEMNGLEAIDKILTCFPDMSIIINSIKDDSDTIFKALQLGAIGYIDKQSFLFNYQEVFKSIENEGAYMTPKIARKIIGFFQKPKGIYDNLSQREIEIVNGILDGLSYKLISDRCNVSLDTVRFHIKGIYKKLKINSKSELFNIFKINPN